MADYSDEISRAIRFFPDGGVLLATREGVIEECNVGFAKMFGYLGTKDVIGLSVDSFAGGPEHKKHREAFSEDLVEREVVAKTKDGKELPIYLSVTRLDELYMVRIRENE